MFFITFLTKNNSTSHSFNKNVSRWTTASGKENSLAFANLRILNSVETELLPSSSGIWYHLSASSDIFNKHTCIAMRQIALIVLRARNINMKAVRTGIKYLFVCAPNVYSTTLMKDVLTSGLLPPSNADVDLWIWIVPLRRKTYFICVK